MIWLIDDRIGVGVQVRVLKVEIRIEADGDNSLPVDARDSSEFVVAELSGDESWIRLCKPCIVYPCARRSVLESLY